MAVHPPYHPYPWPVRFRRVRPGIDLAYMDTGVGQPPLLLIHGLGSYAPSWTRTIQGLENHRRCIAPDLPNYGRSTLGDFDISLRFFAEVLRDFVEAAGLGPVVLAGHSMGAQIAIWCVHLGLFPIEKLILIAPAGFEQFTRMEQGWFRSVNQVGLIRSMPEGQIRRNFEVNFHRTLDDATFMLEDRLTLRQHTEAYDLYCRMIPQCTQAMLDEPVWDLLPAIAIPTLVLFGREDALIPNRILHRDLTTEQVAWEGTRRIPGARLAMIPDAGHFPHWEQADLVNETIRHFLGPAVSH